VLRVPRLVAGRPAVLRPELVGHVRLPAIDGPNCPSRPV
jgi:hypothetical protein